MHTTNTHGYQRLLALILTLCMIVSFLPVPSIQAKEETVSDKSEFDQTPETGTGVTTNASSGYIRNDYIEVHVRSDGHYTIGTVAGDPNSSSDNNKKLLYGHPDSSTTETLIQIDGYDYYFDDYVTDVTVNDSTDTAIATATINGIKIQQILTITTNPYTNIDDVISIRYTYSNTTSYSKRVGVRIMLDTMLGSNDGSPFRVNGQDVTREVEFSGNSVPQYWQSFDSLENPNVTATGFFYFTSSEKPDKVQFAYWGSIRGSSWDYQVNSNRWVTNDSAVAAYFNPRTVAAGGTNTVVTYYGVSGFSGDNSNLEGELAVRITAPSALSGSDLFSGYTNNPFDVSVYLSNSGNGALRDVRAVLNLNEAPELTLDETQATTIRLGDIDAGNSSTIQWTLRAIPQDTATTAHYSISFYEGYEHLKTMNLTLDLAALSHANMYRTVTFKLNGGNGPAPAQQSVLIGTFAEKPENPTRPGYAFRGWYANRDCTGTAWFNIFNLYKGNIVTEDITLYAKWEKAQNLTYGEDTFNFINSSDDFFGWWDSMWSSGNYKLTGDYYDTLLEGRTSSERATLISKMYSSWGGSCFGMSCVLSLVRAGDLDVSYFQDGAVNLYDFQTPNDNATVFNLINYYHLMQYTSTTNRAIHPHTGEAANNRNLINHLKSSAYPVVVCFYIKKNGNSAGGHAVVAYGYTETSSEYRVNIWDPNDKENSNTLIINKSNWSSSFAHTYDSGSRSSEIACAITVESSVYDYKNIQEELLAQNYTSGEDAVSVLANGSANRELNLLTNYSTFDIVSSDGTSAVIENGVVTGGNLNITDGIFQNEVGPELELWFVIKDDGDAEYTIIPASATSVVTGEELAEYKTTFFCHDETNGFYTSVAAADTGVIVFDEDGATTTSFSATTEQTISMAANDVETTWYYTTVEASTSGMYVNAESDGTTITSEEDTNITVTAENDYNSILFEDVDVSANEDVELVEDSANPGTGVLGDERREMGHSLVFLTCGGTPIDAQRNIPAGGTAYRPVDPVLDGFVFDGWYTVPECADGYEWDFATPIYEDVKIYAKWLMDENHTHAVTFKAPGQDDVVILVRDGESLTDEQIPVVPRIYCYDAAWDIDDFSNITSDMVVNAIYTQLPAEFTSATTSLNGMIDLNFYVMFSEPVKNDPTTFVRFTYAGKTLDVPMSESYETDESGYLCNRFSCTFYAKQMADTVVAQVMNADGPQGRPVEYSIMRYCTNMINKSRDEDMVALAKAMLNYGAAAQVLLGYNTDNLANASLSEEDKTLATADLSAYALSMTGSQAGIRADSATLMLESDVTIRVYFKLDAGADIDDYTFTINGRRVEVQQNESGYFIETSGIAAKNLDTMFKFSVGDLTVTYGALSYAYRKMNSNDEAEVNIAKALYAYYVAAANKLTD